MVFFDARHFYTALKIAKSVIESIAEPPKYIYKKNFESNLSNDKIRTSIEEEGLSADEKTANNEGKPLFCS
jgi:hypothetical protein